MKRLKNLKITFNAPVVLLFVGICCIATLLNYVTAGASNRLLFMNYRSSLTSLWTYPRFFTHVFGHSGWSHFFGNATYLLLLGPMLEEKYGSNRLALVMVITAFVTGLVNFIFFPSVALCGASGVVFAFILMTSFTGFRSGEIPLTFIIIAIIFIGQQIVDGIFVQDNISNMAHIIGGVVGAVAGYIMNRR